MKILIVEDETTIADRIQRTVAEITSIPTTSIKTLATFDAARAFITEHPIDLLFLDLNLNGVDGFHLLQEAVAHSFHTIIISAYEEKAVRAFEYGVLDFVTKPFTRERLKKAIDRFIQKSVTGNIAKYLAVKKSGRIDLIEIHKVQYIKAQGDYSELHFPDGKKMFHDKSLEHLQMLLHPLFFRNHKSYMARVNAIKKLHVSLGSKYEAELENGQLLPVGRTRYKLLKEMLLR